MFGFNRKPSKQGGAVLIQRARDLRAAGRYEESFEAASEAVRLAPGYITARVARALALTDLKRYAEALADVEVAVTLDGDRFAAYVQRGNVRREMGDLVGAIEDFTRGWDMRPSEAILMKRVQVYEMMGDHRSMLDDALTCQHHWPEAFMGYYRAGIAYRHLERWQESLDSFDRMAEIAPDQVNHVVLWYRTFALEGLGRVEEALRMVEKAIRQGPEDPVPPQRRIELLTRLGRTSEAESFLREEQARADTLVRTVATRGKFVWACAIQANDKMFRKGLEDLPGTVVFTFQRDIPQLGKLLQKVAAQIASFKNKRIEDPEWMKLGLVTTKEETDYAMRVAVPSALCHGLEMYCQSIKFYRHYLPKGYLDSSLVPCAADLGAAGEIVHLPWAVGEKKLALLEVGPRRS